MEHFCGGRDVIVVLPTGGGKSVCFQAPAMVSPGLAVVVSPLISPMKDQVDALTGCGVPAATIDSSLSPQERDSAIERARKGQRKLLYISPEVNCALSQPTPVQVTITNFPATASTYKVLILSNLPTTETFRSHAENALQEDTATFQDSVMNLTLPPLSVTAVLFWNHSEDDSTRPGR